MGVNRVAEPLLYLGYSKFSGRHAEHDVLIKAKGIMDHSKPFEIINIRLNKRGEIRLSKPCKVCYSWLTTMNCKSIFYSTNEGFETITI